MEPSENPYASPTADLVGPSSISPAMNEAETIRKKYLSHEASVRSIGLLYWIGSFFLFIASIFMISMLFVQRGNWSIELLFGPLYLGLALLNAWLGYGLRKLDSSVRIPVGILSALGLIYIPIIPIGTIINAYILAPPKSCMKRQYNYLHERH